MECGFIRLSPEGRGEVWLADRDAESALAEREEREKKKCNSLFALC